MPITTSEQINRYFAQYKQVEVTFNKSVTEVLGLQPTQVYLKFRGQNLPCILYSAAMAEARVLMSCDERTLTLLENQTVSLRYCFKLLDKPEPIAFFVPAKISSVTPYNEEKPELKYLVLTYTQKPADDLIQILGELLEANVNAKRRSEVRIDINPATLKNLGLESKTAVLRIESVSRPCIVRDLSFSGAKVLTAGIDDQVIKKDAELELTFSGGDEHITVNGQIIRLETVQDQRDIAAAALLFDAEKTPMRYKMHINNFLRTHRTLLSELPQSPESDDSVESAD